MGCPTCGSALGFWGSIFSIAGFVFSAAAFIAATVAARQAGAARRALRRYRIGTGGLVEVRNHLQSVLAFLLEGDAERSLELLSDCEGLVMVLLARERGGLQDGEERDLDYVTQLLRRSMRQVRRGAAESELVLRDVEMCYNVVRRLAAALQCGEEEPT